MDRLNRVPVVLTVAGSDSGAGAGIQADLKTFAALGVYGTSVVTAVTSQNTMSVLGIENISLESIESQLEAVISDIGFDSVKTGMLSNPDVVGVVSKMLATDNSKPVVVDPVMVSKSGDRLLDNDAVQAILDKLLPLATVLTPNVPEAEVLSGMKIRTLGDVKVAAYKIVSLGAKTVVIKGGHLRGRPKDIFFDGDAYHEFTAQRIETKNTHGSGCTFASALAAGLAKNMNLLDAVRAAKEYVTDAIKYAYDIGHGHGPLNHFYKWLR